MNKTKYQSQNFHFLAQNLDISAQKFEIFTAEFHFFGCRIPQGVNYMVSCCNRQSNNTAWNTGGMKGITPSKELLLTTSYSEVAVW